MPKTLYNSIAKQAASHDHVYITCTRALGRIPKENEIVLPCVGALSKELWFSLFMEYDNISVYLPLGVCDRCRTTTGEEAYTDAISYAEELTGAACGLEVDEKTLDHEYSRAYKRSQFLGQVARTGTNLVAGHNAAINGAQAVAQRIQNHTKRVNELTRSLEQAVGVQNSQHHRRMLTQRRELVMAALQKWPEPAKQMKSELPTCDMSKCTMCGDCTEACVLHAIELDRDGKIQIEPAYCIGCGVCARVCKEGALEMHPTDGSALVVPDPHAEEIERERAEVRKLKQQGKKVLDSSLKALGDTFGEDSSKK
jgi:ferredoxin